jgi:hypothetical protein
VGRNTRLPPARFAAAAASGEKPRGVLQKIGADGVEQDHAGDLRDTKDEHSLQVIDLVRDSRTNQHSTGRRALPHEVARNLRRCIREGRCIPEDSSLTPSPSPEGRGEPETDTEATDSV